MSLVAKCFEQTAIECKLRFFWHTTMFDSLIHSPTDCLRAVLGNTVTHSLPRIYNSDFTLFTLSLMAVMNMRRRPSIRDVLLYWTPVETIFYKLCLSACCLPSSIFIPVSLPSLSLSVHLSPRSEVWIQRELSSLPYLPFSHTSSWCFPTIHSYII